MLQKMRKIIGVVAAEVNGIEQRQIMKGIITRAQAYDFHTVVLSNIYNPYEFDEQLALENEIYELALSPELCGIILIAESFVGKHVQKKVISFLQQRQDIPVIVIGIYIKEFAFPNVRFINASDDSDIEEVTRHLVQVHHLKKIDILTGPKDNESAQRRLEGYRKALKDNGIEPDSSREFYGNYWTTSGEAHAKRYISGELPLPEALICANDYMAYGVLDTLLDGGIRVPDDMMVIGYEYIHERIYHSPLLSTYQRGRIALGETAVRMLFALCNGEEPDDYPPPHGQWIAGESCTCGVNMKQMNTELKSIRVKQQFDKWNVLSTTEQQLTRCSTLEEFINVLGTHQFLVRWVQDMYLCLYDNWYDNHSTGTGDLMTCRSIMPWNQTKQPITTGKYSFSALLSSADFAVVQYYLPVFFEQKLFGYYVLQYNTPDTYDDIFRNWMKSLSNGLEFLCMKNDIRYLLSCQNLSEQKDSLTGLYSKNGFERVLTGRLAEKKAPLYAVFLRIGVFRSMTSAEMQEQNISFYQKIAELLQMISPENGMCARLDTQTFVCVGVGTSESAEYEKKREKLLYLLFHQSKLLEYFGLDAVVCGCTEIPENISAAEVVSLIQQKINAEMENLSVQRQMPHADTLFAIRARLYQDYNVHADDICKAYSFSAGYFRQIYKDLFGISFHQDVINARISKAVSLLATSAMSIASVAEACGYEDYNYFLRQFQKVVGMTPGQYRKRV
ncbi:MAG: substrate-binding domain-containing protein [Oscillospiraceae bacterium]|nr:substrate-binding domain-containing protein [Oscillospiraceae bacterium]